MKEMMKRIICILCACMMIAGCSVQTEQPKEDEPVVDGTSNITDDEATNLQNPDNEEDEKESEKKLPIAKALATDNYLKDNFELRYLKMEAFKLLDIESITFAMDELDKSVNAYEWIITDEKAIEELKQWVKEAEFEEYDLMPGPFFAMQIKLKTGGILNLKGVGDLLVQKDKFIKCNAETSLTNIMEKYATDKYQVEKFDYQASIKTGDWSIVETKQKEIDNKISGSSDDLENILPISSIFDIKKTNISNELKYSFHANDLKYEELQTLDIKSIVVVSKENDKFMEWTITNQDAFELFKKWALKVTTSKVSGINDTDFIIQVNTEDVNGALIFGGSGDNALQSYGEYVHFSDDIVALLRAYKENERQVRKPNLNVLMDTKNNYLTSLYSNTLDNYYSHFDKYGVRQTIGTKNDEWKDALNMVFYLHDFNGDNPIQDWTKISVGVAVQEIYTSYSVYGGTNNYWNQGHEFVVPEYARGGAPFTATLVPEEFVIEKGKEYFGDSFSLEQVPEGRHAAFPGYAISYVKPDQLFLVRTPYGGIGYHSANIFKIIHLEEDGNQRTYRGLLYFSQSLETASNDNNETFDSIEDNKDKFRYVEIEMEKTDDGIRINSFKTLHDPNNGLYDESAWSDWDYVPEESMNSKVIGNDIENNQTINDILNKYQNLQVSKIEYNTFDNRGRSYDYSIENQEDINYVMNCFRQVILGYTFKDALYGRSTNNANRPRVGVYSDYVVTLTDNFGNKYVFELYDDVAYGKMISLNSSDLRMQYYGPSLGFALSLKGKMVENDSDIYYIDHGAELNQGVNDKEKYAAQLNISGDLDSLLKNPLLAGVLFDAREKSSNEEEITRINQLLDKLYIEPKKYQYGNTCLIYNEDGTTEKCSGYYATKPADITLYAYSRDENDKLIRYYVVDNQFGYSSDYDKESQTLRNYRYNPERYGFIQIDDEGTITVLQKAPYTTVDVSQVQQAFDDNHRITGGIRLSSESGFEGVLSQIMIDLDIRNYTYAENNEYYSILPVENTYGEFGSNKFMIRKSDGRFMTDQTLSNILLGITFEEFLEPKIIENGYQVCKGENQEGVCAWIPVITEDDQLAGSDMHTTSFYINEEEIYVDIPVYRDGWLIDKLTVQVK